MKPGPVVESLALPDFIVIGAQKAGTSSMYNVLSTHPDVHMSSQKEIHYFDAEGRFRRGLSFYSSHFEHAPPGKVLGEATPRYLFCEKTPGRIAAVLPEVKLIASLRNPADRAFSAWQMQVVKGSETRPFASAVREEPNYIEFGRYHRQLSRYLELFPKEQLLVLLFEDLKEEPDGFYSRLFEFIGVDEKRVDPARFREIPNVGGTPKWSALTSAVNATYRTRNAVRNTVLKGLVNNYWVDRYGRTLRNKIASWNRKAALQRPKLDAETASYIVESLSDDIDKLANLLGRDLSHWKAVG
jgi:hypothetical protein